MSKSDETPVWEGDLDDDCIATWRGLCLRAEAMNQDARGRGTDWWWAVYDGPHIGREELASSNDRGDRRPTGESARWAAELAARRILFGNKR